jgi:hypothetical protein
MLPEPPVSELCLDAEAIVEEGKDAPAIRARGVMLFLAHDRVTKHWRPLATIFDEEGRGGSPGVFWFDERTCHGYMQAVNPGPYVLAEGGGEYTPRIPATVADLRKRIVEGLESARRWRALLAEEDLAKRAAGLAPYLLLRTSPERDRDTAWHYRFRALDPLVALPQHAVPPLVGLLEGARPGDDLSEAVRALMFIGKAAGPAVPELLALLEKPEAAPLTYVLSALAATRDPRAFPVLRTHLAHADREVVEIAARGLGKGGDRESYEAIERLVPEKPVTDEDAVFAYELLLALSDLDPARARPLVARLAKMDSMADLAGSLLSVIDIELAEEKERKKKE